MTALRVVEAIVSKPWKIRQGSSFLLAEYRKEEI